MHQPHHGSGFEALPTRLQRTGQRGHRKESRRLVDAARRCRISERARNRHGQRGILVHEGCKERPPDHPRGRHRHGETVQRRALPHHVHVQPVRPGFHFRDQGHQFRRRIGHSFQPLIAGRRQHIHEPPETILTHQGRIGISRHIPQHRIGLDPRNHIRWRRRHIVQRWR